MKKSKFMQNKQKTKLDFVAILDGIRNFVFIV